jgi:hypothetical protein
MLSGFLDQLAARRIRKVSCLVQPASRSISAQRTSNHDWANQIAVINVRFTQPAQPSSSINSGNGERRFSKMMNKLNATSSVPHCDLTNRSCIARRSTSDQGRSGNAQARRYGSEPRACQRCMQSAARAKTFAASRALLRSFYMYLFAIVSSRAKTAVRLCQPESRMLQRGDALVTQRDCLVIRSMKRCGDRHCITKCSSGAGAPATSDATASAASGAQLKPRDPIAMQQNRPWST